MLILQWVRVPHLASHLLGRVTGRLSADWREKYGHPLYWVESFVQAPRFAGTCYRAAGWLPEALELYEQACKMIELERPPEENPESTDPC